MERTLDEGLKDLSLGPLQETLDNYSTRTWKGAFKTQGLVIFYALSRLGHNCTHKAFSWAT